MAIRLSLTKVVDSAEATLLTTHRSSAGTDHANVGVNDTHVAGDGSDHADVASATSELGQKQRVQVSALAVDTLNNEQSTALGGSSANEWVPLQAILHMEAVNGAAATGDIAITIGTSSGGTQILGATVLTNMKDLNDRFVISLTGLTDAIAGDSTIYVKVTTADSSAGAGHLADCYITGEIFVSGT